MRLRLQRFRCRQKASITPRPGAARLDLPRLAALDDEAHSHLHPYTLDAQTDKGVNSNTVQ